MTERMYQFVPPDKATKEHLLEPRDREHVWTAMLLFRVSGQDLLDGTTFHTDHENLAMTAYGCFVCEEPFSARAYHRKCKGEAS